MTKFLFLIPILAVLACSLEVKNFGQLNEYDAPEYCESEVTYDQLRQGGELKIHFIEGCDSLRLYFPSGGTVTHAGLYKDSLRLEEIASTPSFSMMPDGKNFLTLAQNQKGRYYLNYSSCHWGSRMWLVLE